MSLYNILKPGVSLILICLPLFPQPSLAQFIIIPRVIGLFGNADALFKSGYLMEEKGDREGAKRQYNKAVIKQHHAEAANRLGVLMEREDLSQAVFWHHQAVEWNTGKFSPFSVTKSVSSLYYGEDPALVPERLPSPGAVSALRLGYLFGGGDKLISAQMGLSSDGVIFASDLEPEKSKEFYNKAHSLGVDAWIIAEMNKRHGYKKEAVRWYAQETKEQSMAGYRIAFMWEEEGSAEKAAEWYKKAMGKQGAGLMEELNDERTLVAYESLAGKHLPVKKPFSPRDEWYAGLAAFRLGRLWDTGQLKDGDYRTADWFYVLAGMISEKRNFFLQAAKEHQEIWERKGTAEALKRTVDLYKRALDDGKEGFNKDQYNFKMAELNVFLAAQDRPLNACNELFEPGT